MHTPIPLQHTPQHGSFYAEYDNAFIVGPFPDIAAIHAHSAQLAELVKLSPGTPEVHPGESLILLERLQDHDYVYFTPEQDIKAATRHLE